MSNLAEPDEFELKMQLERATDDALTLADAIAERAAAASVDSRQARDVANFLQQRTLMRRLRHALRAAVAG